MKTIWSQDESTRRSQNRLRKMVGCLFSSAQPQKNVHVLFGSQKCSIYMYIYFFVFSMSSISYIYIYIQIHYQNYQIYHLNLRKVLFGFLFLPHQPRLPEPSFIIALLSLAILEDGVGQGGCPLRSL